MEIEQNYDHSYAFVSEQLRCPLAIKDTDQIERYRHSGIS